MKRIGVGLLLAIAVAAPAAAQRSAPAAPPPERVTVNGRVWERIPLRYVDVRTVAAALGAPVLPTEAELLAARLGGLLAPTYPGYGLPYPGYGLPYGGGYSGGYGAFAAPILPFPATYRAGAFAAPAGFPAAAGGSGGSAARRAGGPLFPGLVIVGDPSTNSLIVDP